MRKMRGQGLASLCDARTQCGHPVSGLELWLHRISDPFPVGLPHFLVNALVAQNGVLVAVLG